MTDGIQNFLLTGRPGVGKTTLMARVVERSGLKAGGFYTQELREQNTRVGFAITTLSGRQGLLSHVRLKSPYRVGKYGVTLEDLEGIGVEEIQRALQESQLVVIDEIGKMELFSQKFRDAVLAALDSEKPVLATVMQGSSPFTDNVKRRHDVELFEVTLKNRDELVEVIVDKLRLL